MHQGGTIRANCRFPRADDPARPRFVVYTCMQPRYTWSDKQRAMKLTAFARRAATAHWPRSPLLGKIFGAPRTYGQPLPEFDWTGLLEPIPGVGSLLARLYGLDAAAPKSALAPAPWRPLLAFDGDPTLAPPHQAEPRDEPEAKQARLV